MFNKISNCQMSPSVAWSERQREIFVDDSGKKCVHFIDVSCDKIDKQQLNPEQINLTYLLEEGIVIDASYARSIFNITDKADIQQYADKMSVDAYQTLTESLDNWDFDKNEPIKSE